MTAPAELARPSATDALTEDERVRRSVLMSLDDGNRRAALELLMTTYGHRLHGYCLRVLRDPALAEDVLQQVFVQAYEGLPSYGRKARLISWLLAIANHRCLDALKAERRRSQRFAAADDVPEPADDSADPARSLDSVQVNAALESCLSRLAPHVRMALLLRYHEGLSFEEMSDMLGEKAATLQARVARAMPFLRACLRAKGVSL